MMFGKLLLCVFAFFFVCVSADLALKNLAGPASDFGLYLLPTPQQNADVQNSASFSVNLAPSATEANVLTQTLNLQVDSDEQFEFTFYSPNDESITLSLKNPKGKNVKLNAEPTYYPFGDLQVPATNYRFKNPVSGQYVLTIKTKPLDATLYNTLSTNTEADAFVVLWNEDEISTHTALNTYNLHANNQIGLVTRAFDNTAISMSDIRSGKVPVALQDTITSAEMNVILPNGQSINEQMKDDGLSADEEADDGVYGALFTASAAGQYILSATVTGSNGGLDFVRTTQQVVTVIEQSLTLTGTATGETSNDVMTVYISANAPVNTKYRAYAEVWGKDASGNDLAICWIGGMAFVAANGDSTAVPLQLNLNWLSRVGAQEPLTLKNVVVQDPDTFVPVDQADEIMVKTATPVAMSLAQLADSLLPLNGEITNEMLEGKRPAHLSANLNASADAVIILSHGYCSTANPFTVYASDWTNAQFFLKSGQNMPHDTFAQEVLKFAEPFGPFSYVGHSQGGAVGLHIKNYYWSGLDQVSGGRLLQSVGTPYQGSSGAGTAANLAKLFGVLCGANTDLTVDGSKLWLSGIADANRALVYYYTSTYVQGKLFGDYCNLATNLVLDWPNDGVSEYENAQLPGGQYQGNVEGWCHSVDMKYEPQCENRERNKLMNSLAARTVSAL